MPLKSAVHTAWTVAAAILLVSTMAGPATALPPPSRVSPAHSAAAAPAMASVASWPSAGHDLSDTRNNPDEHTIAVTNVAALQQKWSVGFPSYLTSTPSISGSTLFLPDQAGNLSALDITSGQVVWKRTIQSYTGVTRDIVRVTPAIADGRVIFGDQPYNGQHAGTHLLAVSASTGALLWNTVVETQQTARITGSAVVDGDTVYVGLSSGDEVDPNCCHFRGSVVALDAATGKIKWRTYTAPVGYTGAAVWGSGPVVDHTTNMLYVGTGNNYTVPAGVCTAPAQTGCRAPDPNDYVDSLLALDLTTGKPAWALRTLNGDVWTKACTSPTACGPDFDFGSSPNLFTAEIGGTARQLVGIGQKSGIYWAADARTGALQWQTRVGPGGSGGGIQWGSAVDGSHIYVSIVNSAHLSWTLKSGEQVTGGAFSGLDPATGHILWQTADPQGAGDFGYVSSANGVVYAGSGAGSGDNMYALDGASGAIRWRFASGGSVMGGAAIVDGSVYWASGYYTKSCPASEPQCGTTYRLYAFALSSVPAAPTALGSTQTATTATLTWSPPASDGGSPVTGYRVARDGTDSHGTGAWSTTVPASTRSYSFGSLRSGATYHLTVQAINVHGTGTASSLTVVMAKAAPTAPTTVSATKSDTAHTATLTWVAPASDGGSAITGYRVARDGTDSHGTGAWSTTVPATTRSYSFGSLRPGATYHLSVQAINAVGTGVAGTATVTMAGASG